MKNLKIKTASVALFFALFTLSASAQPQGRAPHRARGGEAPSAEKIAEIMTDKLDQGLDLTDAQESQIYSINLKYAQEREANRAERGAKPKAGKKDDAQRPNREEMREKMTAVKAQKKAQMVEIMSTLTDDQKVEYALRLSKSGNKNQGRGGQMRHKGQKDPRHPRCNNKAPQGGRRPQGTQAGDKKSE